MHILTIKSVKLENSGIYNLNATNKAGKVQLKTELQVNGIDFFKSDYLSKYNQL